MIYVSFTQVDHDTRKLCTEEPMRTGPSYPALKNGVIIFTNESTWPIPCTPEGAHSRAPLFYASCDDDADLTLPGVLATHTAEEFAALKAAEHQARKPFPSWIGDVETMSWRAPVAMPDDGQMYYWDEPSNSWKPIEAETPLLP